MHSNVILSKVFEDKEYLPLSTNEFNSDTEFAKNGDYFSSITNRIIPIDHISHLYVYLNFLTTYGAIYNKVPHDYYILPSNYFTFSERP